MYTLHIVLEGESLMNILEELKHNPINSFDHGNDYRTEYKPTGQLYCSEGVDVKFKLKKDGRLATPEEIQNSFHIKSVNLNSNTTSEFQILLSNTDAYVEYYTDLALWKIYNKKSDTLIATYSASKFKNLDINLPLCRRLITHDNITTALEEPVDVRQWLIDRKYIKSISDEVLTGYETRFSTSNIKKPRKVYFKNIQYIINT